MDTIFSSASSSQKSAIKIIRVSGSDTRKLPKIFSFKPTQPRVASLRKIHDLKNNVIDNALIMADEKQIRQACSNLIKNSYENITLNKISDGKIKVCFEIENDFASIKISDNGTGIDKSIISKILEPYYTTKAGNSGLGLAITKKIIDDHNGILLIKPLKGSKGTTVILKFPLISKIKKEKN